MDFKSSNLSAKAYCKAHHFPNSTFHKYKTRLQKASALDFIQAELPSAQVEPSNQSYHTELVTKIGTLTLSGVVPAEYVVQLIKGIAQ